MIFCEWEKLYIRLYSNEGNHRGAEMEMGVGEELANVRILQKLTKGLWRARGG